MGYFLSGPLVRIDQAFLGIVWDLSLLGNPWHYTEDWIENKKSEQIHTWAIWIDRCENKGDTVGSKYQKRKKKKKDMHSYL